MSVPPPSAVDNQTLGARAAPGITLLLCAIVAAVDLGGPIFYPGLGKIATEFGVTPAQAQLTVTVNMLGAALSQPFIGPAGDLIGRRYVLLASLLAIVSLSLVTVVVTSFPALIVVRAIQGGLGSAGIVLARAIAHDLFPDQREFTKLVSYLVITTGVCSLVGPLLAGGLVNAYGWRGPVLMLATTSAAVTLGAFLWFRKNGDRRGGSDQAVETWPGWAALGRLLRHPSFYGSTALLSFSMASLFTVFGLSPILLAAGSGKSLLPIAMPMQVAMMVSILSCGFMGGAFLGGLRPATLLSVRTASAAIAAGFALIALLMIAQGPSLLTIVPGGLIVAVASGYLNPITLALALKSDARLAGTASGWSSAISLALAGVGTQLATLVDGSNLAWLVAIGVGYAFLCWISIKAAMTGSLPTP